MPPVQVTSLPWTLTFSPIKRVALVLACKGIYYKDEMKHETQNSVVSTFLQPTTATAAHLNRTGDIDLMELEIY